MINDGDPAIAEDELYITRVDQSSLTMELDEPDTTKSIVTVDEWMERQKQKDLETRDLKALDPEELEEIESHPGADIYAQNCLSCHGENLEGTLAPELTLAGNRFSKEELKDIIQNGKGNMPAMIVDNEEDADVLATWLSEYMTE